MLVDMNILSSVKDTNRYKSTFEIVVRLVLSGAYLLKT